jgi:hypothetical protein
MIFWVRSTQADLLSKVYSSRSSKLSLLRALLKEHWSIHKSEDKLRHMIKTMTTQLHARKNVMRFGTMGTTSPELGRKEQEAYQESTH